MINLDIFGVRPKLYIAKENQFKTLLGSFASVLCFLLILVISIIFGKDFYLRDSPRIISERLLTDEYRNVTLDSTNFIFAFRIEDVVGNFFQSNLFELMITYNLYTKNTNNEFELSQQELKPEICNNLNITDQKFISNKNLSQFYCLDVSKSFIFGGDWTANSLSFFELYIKKNDNIKDSHTQINELLMQSDYYFSSFIQEYYFNPKLQDNSLQIRYKNYFYQLNKDSSRSDYFNFQSYFLD